MAWFDLTDFEWSVIEPLLPTDTRGVERVDDRRTLNGIFWRLRTSAPWADIPERCGPPTTCGNRFRRWRKAGVWDRLLEAVSKACCSLVTSSLRLAGGCLLRHPANRRAAIWGAGPVGQFCARSAILMDAE